MSIVRIAARIALVNALIERTRVGKNVYDSLIGGIEADENGRLNIGDGENRPFISVYTDTGKSTGGSFRSLIEGADTEIVLEWGIAAGMAAIDLETGDPLKDPETGETQVIAGIPDTDDGLEFTLDMIGRQIADALIDPDNEWAEIWREIASGGISAIDRQRAASADQAKRIAAHQLRITATLMNEPVPGEEIPDPLPRIFALMDGSEDSETVAKSALMQAALAGTNEPWEAVQRRLGLTATEMASLGLLPLALTDAGEAPDMTGATLAVEGHGESDVTE